MAVQKRRARGTGSVSSRPRSDGRWESRITLPDGRRRSFYGETWKEAEEKLNQARDKLAKGILADPGTATVDDLASEYIELNPDNLRRRSVESREGAYRRYVKPVIAHVRLSALSTSHIQQVISEARKRGLADNTIAMMFSGFRQILNYGVNAGLLGVNPADRVKAPSGGEPRDLPITSPADIEKLIDAIYAHKKNRTAMLLGIGLAMRLGEVRGLRWRDVDFDQGVIRVRHQLEVIKGEIHFVPLKTSASRRDLPMPDFIVDALRRERREQAERRLKAGPLWEDYDLVCTSRGRGLAPATIARHMEQLCKDADIPKVTFHHLRHLCATMLMARNVPPRVAQAILGHASSTTTMRIYQHVMDDDLREAMAALGSVFDARDSG